MSVIVATVVICAPEDEPLREELLKFFSPLLRKGDISIWPEIHSASTLEEVKKLVVAQVYKSDLIVFIVSPDFLEDDFFYTELITGLLNKGSLRIIPVILKDCLWWETPLETLQVLPIEVNQKKGKLLPNYLGSKVKRERVLCQVAIDLLEVIKEAQASKETLPPPLPSETVTETRILDAAIPSEVELGERLHVLALLRLEGSQGLREYLSDTEKQKAFGLTPEQVEIKGEVEIEYPQTPTGQVLPVELVVKIRTSDFELEKSEERVTLTPEKDSLPCIFPLTAKKLGSLSLTLSVSSLDAKVLFETTLLTTGVDIAGTASYSIRIASRNFESKQTNQNSNPQSPITELTPTVPRPLLEQYLDEARQSLYLLEVQIAGFDALNIPAELKIKLEDKRKEIANLENWLESITNPTTPVASPSQPVPIEPPLPTQPPQPYYEEPSYPSPYTQQPYPDYFQSDQSSHYNQPPNTGNYVPPNISPENGNKQGNRIVKQLIIPIITLIFVGGLAILLLVTIVGGSKAIPTPTIRPNSITSPVSTPAPKATLTTRAQINSVATDVPPVAHSSESPPSSEVEGHTANMANEGLISPDIGMTKILNN